MKVNVVSLEMARDLVGSKSSGVKSLRSAWLGRWLSTRCAWPIAGCQWQSGRRRKRGSEGFQTVSFEKIRKMIERAELRRATLQQSTFLRKGVLGRKKDNRILRFRASTKRHDVANIFIIYLIQWCILSHLLRSMDFVMRRLIVIRQVRPVKGK